MEENSIMVMTTYAGASASDVEMNVTKPLENALNSLSDLKHITSQSKENISVISLEFENGIDITEATNDVRDKLDLVKSSLPDDSDNPILFKFGADDIPILILSATADESTNALYKILDDKIANPLGRISGVGTVSISGAAQREVNVYCDPYKLESYGISIETISSIIAAENRNTPGGTVDFGTNTYSLRMQSEFVTADEMLDLVIGSKNGNAIYLRDVAKVEDSVQERAQESYTNGVRGATIIIQKQSGANSVDIAQKVHEALPKLQKDLPSDIEIGVVIDTSTNILNTMNSLIETIGFTLLIVVLVVFVFLGRWRATIIIAITIPISLIGAFIYLLVTGSTLNIISMSALSLAIGMVVDDAIVVLENITTHIQRGSSPKQASIYATKEVMLSVIASTLTMLAVFLPLTMISGLAGEMFRQLGWIVSIIMIISTTSAITLIPMMSSKMLRLDNKKGKLYILFFTPIEKALSALENGYGRLLKWSVNHRKSVVSIAFAAFFGSLMLLPTIKTEFFPTQDNARLSVSLELPVGTTQSITREIAMQVNKEFREKYPEINVINFSLGQADSDNTFANMSDNGTHIISYNISLVSIEERERGLTEIADLMRQDLEKYTELKTYQVTAGGSSSMGGQTGVEVDIYGFDFSFSDAVANELAQRMKALPECADVSISRGDYIPEIQIDFDREKLALNGLNATTVSGYVRNRVNGSVASYLREDGEEYDIRIRYAPEFRTKVEDIENIKVYNTAGKGITVRELGTVAERMTPPTIERKDRERVVTVTANASQGVALSEIVELAQNEISQMEIPSDITLNIGGSYEDQQDTFSDLFTLLVLIIILVFIVMAAQFESLVDPFVIMFSIPFAFTGVFLGLSVTGTSLGVMALVGLLILMGIVVKNGIVLIDYIKLCRERGMGIAEAVVTGGKSRLRPILMTTLTTVLGMLPLALGRGEGSEMWRSMGMTVAWGLSISTLVTLVLIPVVYCIFARIREKRNPQKNIQLEILHQLGVEK
jgi:HAE1 family hydrophobic/amphiphilic exporter-1